ncbi:MAG: efflux RND transporter periplasmic adaptor subunit, partial [Phycisphaerae bacterium]
ALRLSEFRKQKIEALDPVQTNEDELLARKVSYQRDRSALNQRRAALAKAKLAIPLAKAALVQAETNLERAQTILKDAEERVTETDVLSPIDGIVGDIKVEIGDVIQGGMSNFGGGTVLATVLDMDRLTVGAEVDESDIQAVRTIAPPWAIPGRSESETMPDDIHTAAAMFEHLPVITVESFRDETFTGVIELINPEPRQLSNVVTYMVDVVITSANKNLLLPGMRADIRFTSEHVEDVLLCPNEGIREGRNNELGVYVQPAGDAAAEPQFVACTFGISNGRYSQVLCEDLKERDVVYTKLPAKKNKK